MRREIELGTELWLAAIRAYELSDAAADHHEQPSRDTSTATLEGSALVVALNSDDGRLLAEAVFNDDGSLHEVISCSYVDLAAAQQFLRQLREVQS